VTIRIRAAQGADHRNKLYFASLSSRENKPLSLTYWCHVLPTCPRASEPAEK